MRTGTRYIFASFALNFAKRALANPVHWRAIAVLAPALVMRAAAVFPPPFIFLSSPLSSNRHKTRRHIAA